METQKTIERIEKQIKIINDLDLLNYDSVEFQTWYRNTCTTLSKISEENNKYLAEFRNISFHNAFTEYGLRTSEFDRKIYEEGIRDAKVLLLSIIDEIKEYGLDYSSMSSNTSQHHKSYVNHSRIKELQSISDSKFDLLRLIKYCEELNICYQADCLLTVPMIVRAILDHIPPIFGKEKFQEVANNYGSKSFKDSMNNLSSSLRKIADGILHTHIRKKEVLPNATQIDFSQNLDVLLGEIYRMLK